MSDCLDIGMVVHGLGLISVELLLRHDRNSLILTRSVLPNVSGDQFRRCSILSHFVIPHVVLIHLGSFGEILTIEIFDGSRGVHIVEPFVELSIHLTADVLLQVLNGDVFLPALLAILVLFVDLMLEVVDVGVENALELLGIVPALARRGLGIRFVGAYFPSQLEHLVLVLLHLSHIIFFLTLYFLVALLTLRGVALLKLFDHEDEPGVFLLQSEQFGVEFPQLLPILGTEMIISSQLLIVLVLIVL